MVTETVAFPLTGVFNSLVPYDLTWFGAVSEMILLGVAPGLRD
jgi:hypothetical protein